ncbi:MAG: thioredoxin fold domain-containing protein [Lentisphaerae bacterium]|nr:thioredoxin fold domain-containing protein [Lentisphaerota bacterium]
MKTRSRAKGWTATAILAAALLAAGCREEVPTAGSAPEAPSGPRAEPVHIESEAAFEQVVLKAEQPCLADFYSDSCPPCRKLAPTMERLAARYRGRALICKVDLDAAPALAASYKIRAIPAVLFFRNGGEVLRLVGLRRQREYEQVLDRMLE